MTRCLADFLLHFAFYISRIVSKKLSNLSFFMHNVTLLFAILVNQLKINVFCSSSSYCLVGNLMIKFLLLAQQRRMGIASNKYGNRDEHGFMINLFDFWQNWQHFGSTDIIFAKLIVSRIVWKHLDSSDSILARLTAYWLSDSTLARLTAFILYWPHFLLNLQHFRSPDSIFTWLNILLLDWQYCCSKIPQNSIHLGIFYPSQTFQVPQSLNYSTKSPCCFSCSLKLYPVINKIASKLRKEFRKFSQFPSWCNFVLVILLN